MDQSKINNGGEKEEEVANTGKNKGGMMDLGETKLTLDGGKHPSK